MSGIHQKVDAATELMTPDMDVIWGLGADDDDETGGVGANVLASHEA